MKRRDFIKSTAPITLASFFSNRLLATALPITLSEAAVLTAPNNDRVLVIVQLSGGNDGLNTVLPLDQYSQLAAARSNVLIPDTSALRLGSFQAGLHPAMTGMKNLYDQNRLCIVQNVGYQNPSFSHFRASDIFLTGSDSTEVLDSGWIGRFLETFPNPSNATNDPLAVKIGYSTSSGLQSGLGNLGQTVPTFFTGSLRELQSAYTNNFDNGTLSEFAQTELAFLQNQKSAANRYAARIQTAWNSGTNSQTYPPSPSGVGNNLGNQLQVVARLIKGGLKTRVYWVDATGYDTHAAQVQWNNTTQGNHANLLTELSNAIFTFQTDLQVLGIEDRVLGMTFSEFGRRIKSNASIGTDHGAAAPMFLFGQYVNPTIIGDNPVIPTTVTVNDNLPMAYDYRQIYASILRGWFCLSATESQSILSNNPTPVSAVSPSAGCYSTLPLELADFRVQKSGLTDAQLSWFTANESNTSHFEVERSLDNTTYIKIGKLPAAQHTHTATPYEWLDKNVPVDKNTLFYYRLKMVDNDQTIKFSPVKSLLFEKNAQKARIIVTPNPVTDGKIRFVLRGGIAENIPCDVVVTDMLGRLVIQKNVRLQAEQPFEISKFLSSGIYMLSCQNGATRLTEKIVVP